MVIVNSDISLEVKVESLLEVSYQWFESTNRIDYATNSIFIAYAGGEPTTRQFFAIATDANGSVTTRTAIVTITFPPRSESLTILQQPQSIFVRRGFSGSFSVSAQSSSHVSYQWFKNGVVLENETNTSLVVSNVQIVDGIYDTRYQVRVSDAVGTLMSTSAVLTVLEPPKIYEQGEATFFL